MTLDIPKIEFGFPAYVVGGFVRDQLLGFESKDIDLAVVAPFEAIVPEVERLGGTVFVEKPEYLTVRCKLPDLGDVDIAVARTDGDYTDGRRPDEVFLADSIEDDLARRDATINAIAVNLVDGKIVDPFDGRRDIERGLIRAVGNAESRVREDYLRILRYFRFGITKDFEYDNEIKMVFSNLELVVGLKNVSEERIREELFKCFKADTYLTIRLLYIYDLINRIVFSETNLGINDRRLWLKPTMEAK